MYSMRLFSSMSLPAILLGAALSAKAQAPFVVSDFEDSTSTSKISASGAWSYVTDADSHGNSKVTSGDTTMTPAGINASSFAPGAPNGSKIASLKMAYTYGNLRPHGDTDTSSYDPEVALENAVMGDTSPDVDMSTATKVTFYAKADKSTKLRFGVGTAEVTDYSFYGSNLTISANWKLYTVTLDSSATFMQADWGVPQVPWSKKHINDFVFTISKGDNPTATGGTFYLDDFTIYGWAPATVSLRSHGIQMSSRLHSTVVEGNLLKVTLPGAYRNVGGTVEVFGISGQKLGKAGFTKGQTNLDIALEGKAQNRGLVFFRVLPAAK